MLDTFFVVMIMTLLCVMPTAAPVFAEESHPGLAAEASYSEAVILFHRKQTDEALQILDDLLAKSKKPAGQGPASTAPEPYYVESLELKALMLKSRGEEGDEAKAIEAYEELVKTKPGLKDSAPYHFELAMIYYGHKNSAKAKPEFEAALRARFNATAARFFLGLISYEQNNIKEAGYYFRRVAREGEGELKLVAHYYSGLINLKTSYPLGATRDLKAAREIAATMPADNTTAQQISASVDQILTPFTQPQWMGSFSFLGEYDSNVAELPTSLSSTESAASGKSTPKLVMSASIGKMTAPMDEIQYVASYRASYNRNLNSEARGYEYFANTVSLYINHEPLATTQYGVKLDGSFIFQNELQTSGDPSSGYVMGKYNLGGEFGPYLRIQNSRQIQTEFDLFYRPQKFYIDDGFSGNTIFARAQVKGDYSNRFINPTASLSYEHNDAHSGEDLARTIGLSLSDGIHVTEADQVTVSIDYLSSKYPQSSLLRADNNVMFRANIAHTLSPKMALLGDFNYTANNSSVADSYTYRRTVIGVGLSYSL